MITDIYRIKTQNSIYEIQVNDNGLSRCRKEGEVVLWKVITSNEYLKELVIGASFDIPGVVLTSVVQDYSHLVVSQEPKRVLEKQITIQGFFQGLTEHIKEQANPQAVLVAEAPVREYKGYGPGCSEFNHVGGCTCDLPPACKVEGCTYSSNYGPGHEGSRMCKSGSIASGGTRAHCSCDFCY
jgi:hypothetical protein